MQRLAEQLVHAPPQTSVMPLYRQTSTLHESCGFAAALHNPIARRATTEAHRFETIVQHPKCRTVPRCFSLARWLALERPALRSLALRAIGVTGASA